MAASRIEERLKVASKACAEAAGLMHLMLERRKLRIGPLVEASDKMLHANHQLNEAIKEARKMSNG